MRRLIDWDWRGIGARRGGLTVPVKLQTISGIGWCGKVGLVERIGRHAGESDRMSDSAERRPVGADGVVCSSLSERVLRVRQSNSTFDQPVLKLSAPSVTCKCPEADLLTRLCPYRVWMAFAAKPTSSNSTKHIGPLIFCLKLILL